MSLASTVTLGYSITGGLQAGTAGLPTLGVGIGEEAVVDVPTVFHDLYGFTTNQFDVHGFTGFTDHSRDLIGFTGNTFDLYGDP